MTRKSHFHLLTSAALAATALFLGGCGGGGGGGGGNSSEENSSISGVVTDPAIEGAAVRLVGPDGTVLSLIERTDAKGRFSFDLNTAPPADARLVARGGRDTVTGRDFKGVTLSAPYDSAPSKTIVSPLTTLVDKRMQDSGASMNSASDQVARMLGVEAESLTRDPAASAAAQRASLLVGELVTALGGTNAPWSHARSALNTSSGDVAAAAGNLAGDSDLPQTVQNRLQGVRDRAQTLMAMDATEVTPEAMVAASGKTHIRAGLRSYLKDQGITPDDGQVASLADAIWQGAGERSMPAASPALTNAIRYVLNSHGINATDLGTATTELPTDAVASDTLLADLAGTRALDHTVPLGSGETLGYENAARVDYFFRSDQSPFHRAEQLISDVYTDSARDPVYVNIAAGLAGAGLIDRADLVLQANIFQPRQRAEAMHRVGEEQMALGNSSTARSYWQDALGTYQDFFDKARGGVDNMTPEDASFFMGLRASFRRGGFAEDADRAMQTVRSYLDSHDGSQDFVAYGRLLQTAFEATEDAATAVEKKGPGGGRREQAESALELLKDATFGAAQTGFTCNFRSMYLARYANQALRLDERSEASQAVNEYESMVTGSGCPDYAAGQAGNMASVYGRLGLIAQFKNLVDNHVEPADTNDAADARARLAVYEAFEIAQDGKVPEAIAKVKNAQDTVQDRIEYLTYIGSGRDRDGRAYLARLLSQEGNHQAARQVADAAWDLAVSEAYATEAGDSPMTFIGQGCRKVARLYQWLDQPDKAQNRARTCADRAQTVFAGASTANQADTAKQLGYLHLWVDLPGEALAFSDTLYGVGSYLGTPDKRVANRRAVAELRSSAGETARALTALEEAVETHLPGIADTNSNDGALEDALDEARQTADQFAQLVADVRSRVTEAGTASQQQQDWIAEARDKGVTLLTDGGDLAGGWPGATALLRAFSDPDKRATQGSEVVGLLTTLRAEDAAEDLAGKAKATNVRNERLERIAQGLTGWNDFPGTKLARFDYDGDGQPDFFSPASTANERAESPLSLDGDIDGDGRMATTDRTPYCATCDS